ncbi:hypothetical protein ACFWVF_24475 [Streptomyces sp. NPDC058659]|uniref:hypothetical protein n=1 Tax=unclassified Streptomyces TaxID=2593676 RepID=UPI00364BF5C4
MTARTLVSILASVLLGLQVFAPTPSFASAHTAHHAMAESQPGIKPSGQAPREEIAACRDAGHYGDPTGPLRARDRYRTAADSAPGALDRPYLRQTSKAGEPGTPRTAPRRTSRSSTAHSPAALQTFRC